MAKLKHKKTKCAVGKKTRRGGRKSKTKGADFERLVCKELSLWFSEGKTNSLFWRSSQSGGRATTLQKKGENLSIQAGDVAAIDSAGESFIELFFIECKRYKKLNLDTLFYDMVGEIGPMWDKCKQQAAQYGKFPMLICKENARDLLVFLSSEGLKGCYSICSFPSKSLFVYSFNTLLSADPKKFITRSKRVLSKHIKLSSKKRQRL
jgi:hypothetical protein